MIPPEDEEEEEEEEDDPEPEEEDPWNDDDWEDYPDEDSDDPNAETSPSPKVNKSLALRLQYPNLASVLDGLKNKIEGNSNLLNVLKNFSHLNGQQISTALGTNNGPTIGIKNLPYGYGQYDSASNTIWLDSNLANASNLYTPSSENLETFIEATFLHELIHYGENITNTHAGGHGQNDVGYQFEDEYYGGKVDYNFTTGALTIS